MDKDFTEGEMFLYTTPDGDVKIDVYFQDETIWLTQKKMAELFDVEVNTINYHIKEIFQIERIGGILNYSKFSNSSKRR